MYQRLGLSAAVIAVAMVFASTQTAQAQSRIETTGVNLIDKCATQYENYSAQLCGFGVRIVGIYGRFSPTLAARLANVYVGINARVAAQKIAYVERIGALVKKLDPNSAVAIDAAVDAATIRIQAAADACELELLAAVP